jgi:hypothetical protein
MKRFMASAALAAFGVVGVWGTAQAGSGPGCGWGELLFKGHSGFFAHTTAATTNGTTWNQWFGLTSGTAGCDPNTVVSNEFQRTLFVSSNLDDLSQDMAQGGGDHLDALASLLYISDQDKSGFFSLTQAHLPELLEAGNEGAPQLLAVLDDAMSADPVLAKYSR